MLHSYFFIPAHNTKYIEKSKTIQANFYVLDLEEAVPKTKKDVAISNCLKIETKDDFYIRPYLTNKIDVDLNLLEKLIASGFKKIVLPKSEITLQILDNIADVKIILLIEQASTYLNAQKIVEKNKHKITGLALGSHDLTSSMNLKYNEDILNVIRLNLLSICKTYNLQFIDTASMNINKNEYAFSKECLNAFNMGCDGKFIIHPNQLTLFNSVNYFSDDELEWAKNIFNKIDITDEGLGAININGEIIEKPHLKKLKLIYKYLKK